MLCREGAQATQHATEVQEAMDKQFQARWRQAEAELQDLCKSNSAQAPTLATKLQEAQLEHQQLYTAQERQLQLEAQALKQSQQQAQQAYSLAQEHELAIREFRRQAEEQPEILTSQWTMPNLTVESQPDNLLNTASPGRRSSKTLASELMTPTRPTRGGLRTPEGEPVRYGSSPMTQQYNCQEDLSVPPAQWRD